MHGNKGRKFTKEHKKKLSDTHKGVPLSKEHIRNSAKAHRGLKRSVETRKKISDALKGHPLYLKRMKPRTDGYCAAWSDSEFKVDCKKGACEKCGITCMLSLKVYSMWLGLYHIDLNGMNCHPDNFQTLCVSCHSKLHHKVRRIV